MSYSAGYAGAAAQSYDNSLREWRRLFQVDQQIQLERDRQTADLDYRTREFDWRKDMTDIQNSLAQDTFAMDRLESFYERAMTNWDTMTTDERFALMSTVDAMDFSSAGPIVGQFADSYKAILENNLRDTMTAPEARQYLAGVLNAEYGTHVPQFLLREAYRALEGHDDHDDIVSIMDEWSATTAEDRAAFMENERVRDFLSAQQAAAEVDKTRAEATGIGAQAEYTGALTTKVLQEVQFDADKHPGFLRNLDLTNQALEADVAAQLITNEYLGPQLEAAWRRTLAEIREMDNANAVYEATFELMVDEIIARTDMTKSEARVMLATETARIALTDLDVRGAAAGVSMAESDARVAGATEAARISFANLEVGEKEARIENIRAATRVLDSELDLNASITDNNRMANIEARVRVAQDLVRSGDPELIGAVGRELLLPVVGEERVDGLLDELADIARTSRDRDDALADANLAITLNEQEYLEATLGDRTEIIRQQARIAGLQGDAQEWENAVADRVLNFQEEQARHGMEMDARRTAVLERELAWRMSQPVAGTEGLTGKTWLEAVNAINSATRTDPQAIREQWTAYRQAELDYHSILSMRESGDVDPQQIRNWLVRYQVTDQHTAGNYTQDQLIASLAVLESRMAGEAEILRNQAVGAARAYVNTAASAGFLLTQGELGWTPDLYQSAYANYGIIPTEDTPSAAPIQGFLFDPTSGNPVEGPSLPQNASPTTPVGALSAIERAAVDSHYTVGEGVNFLNAREVWESRLTDEMKDMLRLEGVFSAHDFAEHLTLRGEEKHFHIDAVQRTGVYHNLGPIDSKNGSQRVAYQQFATNVTTNAPRAIEISQMVSPMGFSQEEIDYRRNMGGDLPEGILGHDEAFRQIVGLLGVPEEVFYRVGAVENRNGRLEINQRVMAGAIRQMSNDFAQAYKSVDILARW